MFKKVKLFSVTILASAVLFSFSSCASTGAENQSDAVTSSSKIENSSSSNFKKEVENMKITLVSSPASPIAGKEFAKPFVVSVKDNDGNPYSSYTICIKAPAGKTDGEIDYEVTEVETDENGIISYKPSTFSTSMNGTISFYPKAPSHSSANQKLAKSVELKVPCKVKINLPKGKNIMVVVFDYNESGKMIITPSSDLMNEIWKAGFPYQAQNADFHKQIDQGTDAIYKAAKAMVGGSSLYKYIVYGKVKYASPVTEVEGGFKCSLTGTVTAIDWSTGKDVYTVTKTVTVTDKNKWSVYKACQTKLAKELADDLVYSM